MSDFRRCYKIIVPCDDPLPSVRQLVKKQLTNGAGWWDLIEIWHHDRIVVFGSMFEVSGRKDPAKTATESANVD
jgi:hypothetical protein